LKDQQGTQPNQEKSPENEPLEQKPAVTLISSPKEEDMFSSAFVCLFVRIMQNLLNRFLQY